MSVIASVRRCFFRVLVCPVYVCRYLVLGVVWVSETFKYTAKMRSNL